MELKSIDRLAHLLAHHLAGVLSEEEDAELQQWLDADKQNRQLLEEINQKNFYTKKQAEEHLFHSLSAFRLVQVRRQRHLSRVRLRRRLAGVAAVLLLSLGTAFLYLREPEEVKMVQAETLPAGKSRAVLTLANGERLELGVQHADSVVVQEGGRLKATGEEVSYEGETVEVTEENVLEVPRKGEFRLILSDGTRVWMNSESRIRYPVNFTGNERRVHLEGEAYFEVAKNKTMPFVVEMDEVSIRVLGTAFNARAYKDEASAFATLTEGKIQLSAGGRTLMLQPNEQGIAGKNGSLTKKKVNTQLYTGWKDGRFIFAKQTLEEMMNTLARWYDIEILFQDATVREVTFTGNLERYDSFDKIIDLLEMTGMAHFKVEGKKIYVLKN